MKTIYFASVFVIRPTNGGHELLLGRRADEKYMGGTWQLISGGIEPGETAWQAAIREVREETGLAIDTLYRLTQVTTFYRADVDAICGSVPFCAIVAAGAEATINTEHSALEWVDVRSAAERLMWPADKAALAEVRSIILAGHAAASHLRVLPAVPEEGTRSHLLSNGLSAAASR